MYNRLHLELIQRKLADHAAVFYKSVELFEGVLPDGTAVLVHSAAPDALSIGQSAKKIEVVPIILAGNTGGHALIGYLCGLNNIL